MGDNIHMSKQRTQKQGRKVLAGLIFITLKVIEIGAIFFLPYIIGLYLDPFVCTILDGEPSVSMIGIWFSGVLISLMMSIVIIIVSIIGYFLFGPFIKLNWMWSKKIAGVKE